MIRCLVARVLTTSQQVTGVMLSMWGLLGLRTLLLEALAMTKFFPMVCNTQTIDCALKVWSHSRGWFSVTENETETKTETEKLKRPKKHACMMVCRGGGLLRAMHTLRRGARQQARKLRTR
jgi:hypothetical protein